MAKIGSVWDSTTDVLAGRAGLLAPVAVLAFWLPQAVTAAVEAYGGPSSGVAALGVLVALAALVATIWGQLTVIAVASDPATTRGDAGRMALARLGPAMLVALALFAVAIIAVLPIVAVLLASGFDFEAAAAHAGSAGPAAMAPGAAAAITLYALVLVGLGLWLGARLFLLNTVVLLERYGIGAIARSVRLTRGLTLKLIGVALLLAVVYLVAAFAAQSVVFIVFRLILGAPQIATAAWLGSLAAGAIGAVFNVVVGVFAARLYAAVVPEKGGVAA